MCSISFTKRLIKVKKNKQCKSCEKIFDSMNLTGSTTTEKGFRSNKNIIKTIEMKKTNKETLSLSVLAYIHPHTHMGVGLYECNWCWSALVTHLQQLIGWSKFCNQWTVTTVPSFHRCCFLPVFIFCLSSYFLTSSILIPYLPPSLTFISFPSFPTPPWPPHPSLVGWVARQQLVYLLFPHLDFVSLAGEEWGARNDRWMIERERRWMDGRKRLWEVIEGEMGVDEMITETMMR